MHVCPGAAVGGSLWCPNAKCTGPQVTLSSAAGLQGKAVTDATGRFSIPVATASAGAPSPSAQDLLGALISLSTDNSTCVDSATGLPLAVSLGALLPQYGDGAPLRKHIVEESVPAGGTHSCC